MIVRFLLVCEGSSDSALVSHIRSLLIENGVAEADGTFTHAGSTLTEKIRKGLEQFGSLDLLFVHRDADHYRENDASGAPKRYAEIADAVLAGNHNGRYVGIVPVRMTEAWLLVDESAIRRVAGKPNGRNDLGLPAATRLERISNPKESLEDVLMRAGAPRGARRIKNFRNDFGNFRRQLIENLPVGGALEQLDSWVRFRDETVGVLRQLAG